MDQLDQLVAQAGVDFAAAADSAALETAKARYLGKGGSLTELLKGLGKLDPEARKTAGAEINKAKTAIEALLNARRDALQQAALEA
jgi:phenylalanyl-tRNA synthetase alpha chain